LYDYRKVIKCRKAVGKSNNITLILLNALETHKGHVELIQFALLPL